jgi:hypothetical protein
LSWSNEIGDLNNAVFGKKEIDLPAQTVTSPRSKKYFKIILQTSLIVYYLTEINRTNHMPNLDQQVWIPTGLRSQIPVPE